jgi:hypothetical protein
MLRPALVIVREHRRRRFAATTMLLVACVTAACSTSSTTTATPAGPDPVKCQVSLAAPSMVDASGGATSLSITAQPECAWTASSAVNWISGLSPASGQGNGNVEFRVAPNEGGSGREGEIVVNESHVRVSQRAPCRYEVGPPNQSLSAGGDGGSVSVTTSEECAWSATADVGWINLSPPLSGSGRGTVGFTVAPNGGVNERTGSITIGGQRSVVTQGGVAATCSFAISPASQNIAATGGAGTVALSTQAGCRWTAVSNAAWITVTSGASGTGNGSVGFSVAANAGAARTGTLTIGGRAFTVSQAAVGAPPPAPPPPPPANCSYSISPSTVKIGSAGGTGSINVSTTSGCAWTASSGESWITITSGASGTGNGTVGFTVAKNTGKKRNGELTIAGRVAKVEQE